MNRRNFLKAFSITAAGIAVPELIVPERRFWQLDRTMVKGHTWESEWFDASFQPITKHNFYLTTTDLSPEMKQDFQDIYRKAHIELERALLFGEYDTPTGEFVKQHRIKLT